MDRGAERSGLLDSFEDARLDTADRIRRSISGLPDQFNGQFSAAKFSRPVQHGIGRAGPARYWLSSARVPPDPGLMIRVIGGLGHHILFGGLDSAVDSAILAKIDDPGRVAGSHIGGSGMAGSRVGDGASGVRPPIVRDLRDRAGFSWDWPRPTDAGPVRNRRYVEPVAAQSGG
jgi:hypothetical protein